MPGGGSKPGERRGGRKPGTKNKATAERRAIQAEAIERALSGGETPLDVMTQVMHGNTQITDRQLQAAIAAAPYVHPRLASVDMNATIKDARDLSDAELAAIAAAGRAGAATAESDTIESGEVLH